MSASQNLITNLSKEKYTIKAQSTTTITFNGASPNYFRITNGGDTALYLGASMMPTERFFDMKVPSASSKLHVEAHGKQQIHIYNPSITDANIIVLSFSGPFDASVLALSDMGQDFTEILLTGEFDATGDMKTHLENMSDVMENYVPMLMSIRDHFNTQKNVVIRQETNTTQDITLKLSYIELLSNDSNTDLNLKINNVNFTLKPNEVLNKVQFTRQLNVFIPKNASFRVIGG